MKISTKIASVSECSFFFSCSKENQVKEAAKKKAIEEKAVNHVTTAPSSLFFQHNTALGPPYRVLVDTNFINFSLQNKIELVQGMMDCLYAKSASYPLEVSIAISNTLFLSPFIETAIPCITSCVMAELEKLGPKYRIALRVARDPRFERLPCSHKGTYADDCLIDRINTHKCYIVATCDRELRRRVRKVPVSESQSQV